MIYNCIDKQKNILKEAIKKWAIDHASMMEILLSILKNNNNKKGGRKEMR